MSDGTNFIITTQQRSKGGKTAAKNMTKEALYERALKASHSRKCYQNIPKATHFGEMTIGNTLISCAVLEDGRRVITETSMFEILGRTRGGRDKRADLPRFLDANNLKPFIPNEILSGPAIIEFVGKKGKNYGYEAILIPEICKVYLDARRCNVLIPSQLPTAEKAEIILHSIAKVGIIALIDESTGFQKDREKNELQKLFNAFLAKELQPWTRRFPNSFFDNIKRMYGLEHLKGNPLFAGHLINRYIYDAISPEVLEELKKRNPLNDKGNRNHKHHQFLSENIGHPALEKQIMKVNTLMSVSDSKDEFEKLFEKSTLNKS